MTVKREIKLMGNMFTFGADAADESLANHAIDNAIREVQRIEKLFTTFNETSETCIINANAGIQPVKSSMEMIELIERSQKISRLTQGAFDLSYGSLDKEFWNFNTKMTELPNKKAAEQSISKINFNKIHTNRQEQTVFLEEEGMRIGFGGIGKGYAADKAGQIMKDHGITRGFVSASGDVFCWGPQDQPWNIAVELPENVREVLGEFHLNNYAVATSGDYEKFVEIDGIRYSHTIDPKTGFPAKSMKSVTVIAPYAELADALCTPLMIMGPDIGLHLINQLSGIEAIIVDQYNTIHYSQKIKVESYA